MSQVVGRIDHTAKSNHSRTSKRLTFWPTLYMTATKDLVVNTMTCRLWKEMCDIVNIYRQVEMWRFNVIYDDILNALLLAAVRCFYYGVVKVATSSVDELSTPHRIFQRADIRQEEIIRRSGFRNSCPGMAMYDSLDSVVMCFLVK